MTPFPAVCPRLAVARARRSCSLVIFFALALTALGQNLLTNGDFSQLDGNGKPLDWTMEDSSIVSIDTADHPTGYAQSLSVAMPSGGGSTLGYVQQDLAVASSGAPLAPNSYYAARVWLKSSASGQAELQVKRFSAGVEVDRLTSSTSGTSWSQVTVGFDTNPGPSGQVIDDVQVLLRYKMNATAGQLAKFAGAELLDGSHSTLGTLSLVSTFESVSVYAPVDGALTSDHTVEISYRPTGTTPWLSAMAPERATVDNEFRGSVMLLQPNTSYDVQAVLKLNGTVLDTKTASVTTWDDHETYDSSPHPQPASSSTTLTISGVNGTAGAWAHYYAASGGSTIDVGSNADYALYIVNSSYVEVDGLTIKGGRINAVYIYNSNHIRLRNCDISGWSVPGEFGKNTTSGSDVKYGYFTGSPYTSGSGGTLIIERAGVHLTGSGSHQVVIERNLIHDPQGKSASWAIDDNNANDNHPAGPSGIILDETSGNNVVRDNDIIAGDGHRFNDVIEGNQNGDVTGGPSLDTDISGNLLSASNDDGTELDGGQKNVRYWHNWVDGTHSQISTAPVLQGPSYVFDNVFVGGDERGTTEDGFKMGGAYGTVNFVNNTVYSQNYGFSGGHSEGPTTDAYMRNNIFSGPVPGNGLIKFDKSGSWTITGDIDHDLIPVNGINAIDPSSKEPNRVEGYPNFDDAGRRSFLLLPGSPGVGAGVPVPNLTPTGVTNPDMGAVSVTAAARSFPPRSATPDVFPGRAAVRVRAGTSAVTTLELQAPTETGSTWTATPDAPWVTLSATGGATGPAAQFISCTIDAASLAVGTHRTFVSFRTDTGALRTALLDVEVAPATDATYVMEAEDGLPSTGFERVDDPTASGGAYAHAYPGASGSIRQTINVDTAGYYYLHARVRADGPSSLLESENSLDVSLDGGPDLEWDMAGLGTSWSWDTARLVSSPITSDVTGPIYLGSGTHTIDVIKRESGLQLDLLLVSNNPYPPRVATPTFSPPGGSYSAPQSITLATATPGASIRYTTDGSAPTPTHGIVYTGPVSLATTTFLRAVAYEDQMERSDIMGDYYAFSGDSPQVAAPSFAPGGGTYFTAPTVTIASATDGVTIRYTTDGSDPSETSGTVYTGPLAIGGATTLKAVAFRSGWVDSSVTTADYTLGTIEPAFSPLPGTYSGPQTVSITSATPGASIRYTVDGSSPTKTTGTLYSGPVTIAANTTLNAIAFAAGRMDSAVATGAYRLKAAAPAFTPAGGTYTAPQTVTLTTTTTGATIRYTTDGSTPSESNGTVYSGPIAVSGTTTLRAIAYGGGYADSDIGSATYTLDLPPTAAPEFTPAAGTYDAAQTITLSSATPGATIRYTTDGSAPTETNGTVYAGPFPVTSSRTAQAIAYASGMNDSPVTSAAYVITAAYQMSSGQVVVEAEHYLSTVAGTDQWNLVTDTGASGTAPGNAVQCLPNDGTAYPSFDPSAARIDYQIDVPTAGSYFLHLRDYGATSSDDSVYASLDDGSTGMVTVTAGRTLDWKTSSAALSVPAGLHTITIWEREDGIEIDKLVLSASSVPPTGVGPAESATGSGSAGGPAPVVPPVFDPPGGTYVSAATVAITTTTSDAAIRYTLDGTTPTSTTGIAYTGPVTITSSATLQAVAYRSDGSLSTLTTGTYTIQPADGAFLPSNGNFVMEAEDFTAQSAPGSQSWVPITEAGASGPASNNALQALPNVGTGYPTLNPAAPRLDYLVDVPAGTGGNYYVHVRDVGATSNDDSLYVSIDGATTPSQVVTAARSLGWKTSGGSLALGDGLHTISVWMREDGIVIDKLVVSTSSTPPTGEGPAESTRVPSTTAPQFSSTPVSQAATVGDTVVFSASATGSPSPTYQWQKDGVDLPGATGSSLTLAGVTTSSAGSYAVVASNSAGEITSQPVQLTVNPAAATVTLGSGSFTYDGSPHAIDVSTVPAGLPVVVTYDGGAAPPTDAGTYAVTATVDDPDYTGSASGTLTIAPAEVQFALEDLTQRYDGSPKPVTVAATPAGIAGTILYDGSATAPTFPGTYAVTVTSGDANHVGTTSGILTITTTALVRHAPTINGAVDGSVQVIEGENVALNGGASISGDLLAAGTPSVRVNGHPTFDGVIDASGLESPGSYQIMLNGGVSLRHIVRRVDPVTMATVAAPPSPVGTRDVTLDHAGQGAGDFTTVRNLTLNGQVGVVSVPPGSYGQLTANGGSGFQLGVAGATEPSVYNLRGLTLNGGAVIQVVGPVVVVVGNPVTFNGSAGTSTHPEWLELQVATGGVTLNGGVSFAGNVLAPAGAVIINGGSKLVGSVICDRLTVNAGATLSDP
ncbi:MAG TPA: chitobiase/beta-hexosaminidase C-terminal domain-containing protein [Opitutaceae bacterium]|nr:chitobiase/beta-hexosaminidase C-terminal domain-containing protein [Opitutaceae bacterium]